MRQLGVHRVQDNEKEQSDRTVEQVVRPTGLVDPEVEVRPASIQVDDLLSQIRERVRRQEPVEMLTGPHVAEAIRENGLYLSGESGSIS